MKNNWLKLTAATVVLGAGMCAPALAQVAQAKQAKAPYYTVTVPQPGNGNSIQSLDPDAWAAQILVDQGTVLEGLFGYDTHLNIVPKICDHYTVSKDGLVWTFYLRKDAKWSNGAPVTANDFYYAWMRFLSPQDSQAPMWESFTQFVKNGWAYHQGAATAKQVGIKVLNNYAIRVTLSKPEPDLLGYMVLTSAMPLYKPVVEKHPSNWFLPQYFVGNGPYVVKSFTPNGKIVLVKNKHYVGRKGQFNVGNVDEIDLVPAPSTPVEAYMGNKLDVAQIIAPSDYQYVKKRADLKAQMKVLPNWELISLAFDKSTDASPLDNPLVRKAIAEAIDRDVLANVVLNGLGSPTNVFGPKDWPATKYQHGLPYNVADARKLLAKAGYPNGKGIPTLYIYTPPVGDPQVQVAVAIAQMLRNNLGINFKIEPTPWNTLGSIIWGGYNKGVKPGYVMFHGVVNWWAAPNMTMQSDFATWYDYPVAYRKYVAEATLNTPNPYGVKEYGNPNNAKLGTKWTDFDQLQVAFKQDAAFLENYIKQQKDPVYKRSITPDPSYEKQWQGFLDAWKRAKTDAERHQAWVNAWNWIAGGSVDGVTGLDLQVWEIKHTPEYAYKWKIMESHIAQDTLKKAAVDAGKLNQTVLDAAWYVPLYDPNIVWLQRPWLTNVIYNRFSWGNFFQLQYLTVKPH